MIPDRICYCCNRPESRINHVRVGREGKVLANRMRKLMSWYAQ
jgi:hypothetical protein